MSGIFLATSFIFLFLGWQGRVVLNCLSDESARTDGIIKAIARTAKGGGKLTYTYSVSGKQFESTDRIESTQPFYDSQVGDLIAVDYCSSSYQNSTIDKKVLSRSTSVSLFMFAAVAGFSILTAIVGAAIEKTARTSKK